MVQVTDDKVNAQQKKWIADSRIIALRLVPNFLRRLRLSAHILKLKIELSYHTLKQKYYLYKIKKIEQKIKILKGEI